MKNFTLSIVFFLIVLIPLISKCQTATAPAGSGSSIDPYQIASLSNLYWITADNTVVPSPSYTSRMAAYYIQTADIDASFTSTWFSNTGWVPIGKSNKFTGSYDGKGFAISGLFINSSSSSVGLFSITDNPAIIQNVVLKNVNITGGSQAGALIGYSETTTSITNCSTSGIVSSGSNDRCGGLIGIKSDAGVVSYCYSSCTVSGNSYTGGLVGWCNGGSINKSYSTGSVSSSVGYSGGFIGYLSNTPNIVNCYSISNVTCTSTNLVGGFIGYIAGGTVDKCYAIVNIPASGTWLGRFTGYGTSPANSYYSSESSGATGSASGVAKTNTELQTLSTFSGWDFSTVWKIDATNNGFPSLVWLTYTWTGGTSTDWSTGSNWSSSAVPISTINAAIPSGTTFSPSLSSMGFVANITINSGASLTIANGGILNSYGSVSNSGSLDASNGTIAMNSLSAQTIPASTFSTNTIKDLIINNSAGVTLGGVLAVRGTLTPTAGALTTGGYLTISPAGSVASGAGSISGNVTVQQNLTNQRGWRVLGSPFTTDVTLANLATATNIDITYGGANIYGGTSAASAETYNPSSDTWNTLSSGNSWAANSAMALYIRGTKGQGIPGSGPGWVSGLDYGGGSPDAVTLSATGILNTATFSYGITATKFNFVPNPFAAAISVQGVIGSGTNFYYYNPASGASDVKTKGGAYIPVTAGTNAFIPKYGCFVYTPASGTTLSIPTSAISIGGSPVVAVMGINNNKLLEIIVESNAVYYDKMFVQLDPNCSINSGDTKDLAKFYNDVVNVYAIAPDNKKLAIDARNVFGTIPLGMNAPVGNYNFKVANNSLPTGTVVYLNDKFLKTQTEIKTGGTYNFSITADTASKGDNRFELTTAVAKAAITSIDPSIANFTAEILGNVTGSNTVTVKIMGSKGPVNIRATDMAGRNLSITQSGDGIQKVQLGNIRSGMLLLQFSDGKSTITKKIIKF